MSYRNPDTEDQLVEQPAIALLREMRWQTVNCFDETFGSSGTIGRETRFEVVLVPRLRAALERLNPDLPAAAISAAIDELTRDRSVLSPAAANREIYTLLKGGVNVSIQSDDGGQRNVLAKAIDWDNASNNDFLLASQLWITGEIYTRRADLVGFVNGLPLVFIELKASHRRLEDAYKDNLRDYKSTIPHLFWYNAFIILSNGSESRIGTLTAEYEHFAQWKKINREGEQHIVSLETMLRGTCEPTRLLDLVENFTLFHEGRGGLSKLIAKNHQYLGVNSALDAVRAIRENEGRLGVFWHTQGSGKSYSMVFFANKVLRKLPGNWTFVVVTDRTELDDQIYKNFASVGAVAEPEESLRAQSGAHLKQLLQEDHRFVFTLIQKFRTESGEAEYPKLSDRSDIIVMTDEAHRTQYDTLALNMRHALPKAAFIGFTGTPLIVGEEKTRQVFGNYVSIYNFKQSADDHNTVRLYYENRIPELQLTNENLNEDMTRLLEDAQLDEAQETKLEREFAREYHLITRDERLERIAEDIVIHFMSRGYQGKAMVISVDKATAVKMYDKVQKYWNLHLTFLEADLAADPANRQDLERKIEYMRYTDMAVVVSQSQNEVEDLRAKGVEILPHRRRMLNEDLEDKFKDPPDPLRIVFLCAMWMTGFDVPSCSTIYLDKPMRNHTLMQTIARANRVFGDKQNGLIVDYVGVFHDLQKALAIYGSASGGGIQPGEMPVEAKADLVNSLRRAIAEAESFCSGLGADIASQKAAEGFERVRCIDDAVDAILVNDESKRKYLLLENRVSLLYRAVLPDRSAGEFAQSARALAVIAAKIHSLSSPVDISGIMGSVENLLDTSISPTGYVIHGAAKTIGEAKASEEDRLDLTSIDFEALRKRFEQARKRIQIEKLRAAINGKLARMVRLNRTRMDYYDKFQELIAEYNAGASSADVIFTKLVEFAQSLNEEEQRGIAEQLDEEELAIFDLLTKPNVRLSKQEKDKVKEVARDLLTTLKAERLVLDWRKRQQTRASVRLCIEENLDRLPPRYTSDLYRAKCDLIYQHVYDSYFGQGKSIYATPTGG